MRLLDVGTGVIALWGGMAVPALAAAVNTRVSYDQSGPGGYSLSARTDNAAGPASNSLVTPVVQALPMPKSASCALGRSTHRSRYRHTPYAPYGSIKKKSRVKPDAGKRD